MAASLMTKPDAADRRFTTRFATARGERRRAISGAIWPSAAS
jgi:hypothetical protein